MPGRVGPPPGILLFRVCVKFDLVKHRYKVYTTNILLIASGAISEAFFMPYVDYGTRYSTSDERICHLTIDAPLVTIGL